MISIYCYTAFFLVTQLHRGLRANTVRPKASPAQNLQQLYWPVKGIVEISNSSGPAQWSKRSEVHVEYTRLILFNSSLCSHKIYILWPTRKWDYIPNFQDPREMLVPKSSYPLTSGFLKYPGHSPWLKVITCLLVPRLFFGITGSIPNIQYQWLRAAIDVGE